MLFRQSDNLQALSTYNNGFQTVIQCIPNACLTLSSGTFDFGGATCTFITFCIFDNSFHAAVGFFDKR